MSGHDHASSGAPKDIAAELKTMLRVVTSLARA